MVGAIVGLAVFVSGGSIVAAFLTMIGIEAILEILD